jgi:predicted lipid-binding transport protein (Tim44 family)
MYSMLQIAARETGCLKAHRTMKLFRSAGILAVALATMVVLGTAVADARTGGGRSFGSRGTHTFSPPPMTNTAPKPAAPIERSMTQSAQPSAAQGVTPPSAAAPASQSRFGGWRGVLLGGLVGAGLISLFGFGGAFAAILGFLLQAALVGGLVWLAMRFVRSRMPPAPATSRTGGADIPTARTILSPAGLGGLATRGGYAPPVTSALAISPADYDAFEKLLGEIQEAYGREDLGALGDRTTPEMLSYLAQDLADNAKHGLLNQLSGVKLLQGDLSEAWREAGGEYATVAMRFAIVDAMVDRATGRVVGGDRSVPQEVTEVWTFRRDTGSDARGWELSAIQQV